MFGQLRLILLCIFFRHSYEHCNNMASKASERMTSVNQISQGLKEEMKNIIKNQPSVCAKCVVCAAMVFALIKEFSSRNESNKYREDELTIVCDRRLPTYRMWDVQGIRYLGEPTVNARQVLQHEPLTPAIHDACSQMKFWTTGDDLHRLWMVEGTKKFITDLCFDPYHHPGLSSCRGVLKNTTGVELQRIYRRTQFLGRMLDYYFYFWRHPFCPGVAEEYKTLLAWYTLGNHELSE